MIKRSGKGNITMGYSQHIEAKNFSTWGIKACFPSFKMVKSAFSRLISSDI